MCVHTYIIRVDNQKRDERAQLYTYIYVIIYDLLRSVSDIILLYFFFFLFFVIILLYMYNKILYLSETDLINLYRSKSSYFSIKILFFPISATRRL